jgi:GNAT superfamily N-acetyltransferase
MLSATAVNPEINKETFMQSISQQPEAPCSGYPQAAIIVRPLAKTDATLIEAMHERLSPASIYSRYLQYRKPTLAEITAVCHLDPAKGAGFVAIPQEEPTAIVGLAYYVREPQEPEPTAEPGILVEDGFQEQGVGRCLWQQLQRHAQKEGLRWLRVLSHPDNQRLTRLVQGGGLPYAAKFNDGLNEYRVALTPLPPSGQWARAKAYTHLMATDTAIRPTVIGQWRNIRDRPT